MSSETHSAALYTPELNERQLTLRAVLMGCFVGSIVSCTNIYVGLKIGWSFGASIIAAVLSISFFSLLNRRLSILETNIAQTAGSAAGNMSSAAGLLAAIPAMSLLGFHFSGIELTLWAFSIAFLGVFFAVPLRRQLVDVEQLRFPTGTATAETILAMYGNAAEATSKSRALILSGLVAGSLTLSFHFYPFLEKPPLHEWWPNPVLVTAAAWGFSIYLGPALLGAGFLIGPRVVLSLVGGAILAWGILGPWVQSAGWAPGAVGSYTDGPRGWILWPGVALMVSEALMALALSWRTFVNALMPPKRVGDLSAEEAALAPAVEERIPNSWWIGGLAMGSLLTITMGSIVFEIPWYLSIVAIALSALLSVVAVRALGETDINPVGGVGKVTQLVFGAVAPGSISTNLMAAGITAAGASQAADMMQDLKTGRLLGASPRKQLMAQLLGVFLGSFTIIPAYLVLTSAYELGSDKLPAPAAMAWKAMAELLDQGMGALPPHAVPAVIIACVVGAILACLQKIPSMKRYVPSGMAMGIAFIIFPFATFVMLYGLIIWWIWRSINSQAADKYTFVVASGLIAGEGLMGLVNAGLMLLQDYGFIKF